MGSRRDAAVLFDQRGVSLFSERAVLRCSAESLRDASFPVAALATGYPLASLRDARRVSNVSCVLSSANLLATRTALERCR